MSRRIRITDIPEEQRIQMQKQWEELTLANDFLFGRVMSDKELCLEMIRRILPEHNIEEIELVQTQKSSRHTLDTRGVRFDVIARINNRRIFSIEIQTTDKKDLPKRTRAYHIANGLEALKKSSVRKSGRYQDLPDVFVIFICTFDPFREGRHIYRFQNICDEKPELKLNDGAYTIFLNTEGKHEDISPELKIFLDFVAGRISKRTDSFIEKLEQKLTEAKQNAELRRNYMLLLMRDQEKFAEGKAEGIAQGIAQGRAEGKAEGIAEGKAEGIVQGRAEGIAENSQRVAADMLKKKLPLSLIAEISKLSETTIRNIAGSLGLAVM